MLSDLPVGGFQHDALQELTGYGKRIYLGGVPFAAFVVYVPSFRP
jgi:hypothetical protein